MTSAGERRQLDYAIRWFQSSSVPHEREKADVFAREMKKLDRYGLALMMISEGCADPVWLCTRDTRKG